MHNATARSQRHRHARWVRNGAPADGAVELLGYITDSIERISMATVPEGYESLLARPLYGHLATVRPDGTPQVNAMWFDWDGELLRFTHTTKRQKYRNVTANPAVAM